MYLKFFINTDDRDLWLDHSLVLLYNQAYRFFFEFNDVPDSVFAINEDGTLTAIGFTTGTELIDGEEYTWIETSDDLPCDRISLRIRGVDIENTIYSEWIESESFTIEQNDIIGVIDDLHLPLRFYDKLIEEQPAFFIDKQKLPAFQIRTGEITAVGSPTLYLTDENGANSILLAVPVRFNLVDGYIYYHSVGDEENTLGLICSVLNGVFRLKVVDGTVVFWSVPFWILPEQFSSIEADLVTIEHEYPIVTSDDEQIITFNPI